MRGETEFYDRKNMNALEGETEGNFSIQLNRMCRENT